MWTPNDVIGGIRRFFAGGAAPVAVVDKYRGFPGGEVFARAVPEKVRIVETYSYQQEVSRNRDIHQDESKPPTGRIEVAVPYDGNHFFTRQARSDVEAQVPPDNTIPTDALVGHVVLTDYGAADFRGAGNRSGGFTSIPIRVPVSGGRLPRGYHHLVEDLVSCVINHDYQPDPSRPEILPVTITFELLDGDSLDVRGAVRSMSTGRAKDQAKKITSLGTFGPYLQLKVQVLAHVEGGAVDLDPVVSRVAIKWPTVTSLSSFTLGMSDESKPELRYNPETGCIEWRDIPLTAVRTDAEQQAADKKAAEDKDEDKDKAENKADDKADSEDDEPADEDAAEDAEEPEVSDDDGEEPPKQERTEPDPVESDVAIRTYQSPVMSLYILQPGELYQRQKLPATVDVTIPKLLSGTEARLFGGDGRRVGDCAPELTSEVSTELEMILDDAFAERVVSTTQRLHFEEVPFSSFRVEDIRKALRGFGFWADYDEQLSTDPFRHLLVYSRQEGADQMQLWYVIDGTRVTTKREKVVAGETLTTAIDGGDLDIFVYGTLRANSRKVTQMMNAVQEVLRLSFAHVRVRR